jgi:hypothetical protein
VFFGEFKQPNGSAVQGPDIAFLPTIKQEMKMKIYALLMIMLVALAGCSTTYKGTIDGASNQQEKKNGISLVQNTTGVNPSGAAISR